MFFSDLGVFKPQVILSVGETNKLPGDVLYSGFRLEVCCKGVYRIKLYTLSEIHVGNPPIGTLHFKCRYMTCQVFGLSIG